MSDLEKTLAQPTMSSIELLALINQARAAFNEPEVRRNQFNARVEDELEGTHYKKTVVTNENGTESIVFELTQDQCMLVSMRESKAVRRWVLEKIKAMGVPQTYAQALLEAGRLAQLAEEQAQQLALAAPKVNFFDKGLGELKQTELGYSQPLFTTAGEAWIVERLTSEGVAC